MISQLPILNYHHIGEQGYPASLFKRFMLRLAYHGYRTLKLQDAINLLQQDRVPEKSFVITFDDGYTSTLSTAAPLLQSLGFTATVFPLTPASLRGPQNTRSFEGRALLSPTQIRELHHRGFSIGSHTVDHPDLCTLNTDQVIRQLEVSKDVLEQTVCSEVNTFAYPYGRINPEIKLQVKLRFQCACGTRLALIDKHTDQFELNRIDMHMFNQPILTSILTQRFLPQYLYTRRSLLTLQRRFFSS